MGIRRQARELALQLLYEIDLCGKDSSLVFRGIDDRIIMLSAEESNDAINFAELEEFSRHLVQGVRTHLQEIDQVIETHSTHWKVNRMTFVDRNILRMAVFEMLHCQEIPPSVSINEAIEIAKRFGTEESGAFINGILDHIAKEMKAKLPT